MSEKKTKTGTRRSKEYNDRWWKPLVNPATTLTEEELEQWRKENREKEKKNYTINKIN